MNQLALIGFLILAMVVAIFSVQNSGDAVVTFIWWQFHSSLVVVILIAAALGAIMAILLSLSGTVKLRMRIREQSQRIAELEREIQERDRRPAEDAARSHRHEN